MTPEEFRKHGIGKVFLIGITFYDANHKLLEQYQTSGIVEELTEEGLLILRRKDNSLFPIPYDGEAINKAGKGEYRAHSTDEVIIDPDYIITGDIEVKDSSGIEKIKKDGFVPV